MVQIFLQVLLKGANREAISINQFVSTTFTTLSLNAALYDKAWRGFPI